MSINSKKLSELIENEISGFSDLTKDQKDILSDLCKSIFLLESSSQQYGVQNLINDISGKISNAADRFKEDGQ